MKRSMKALLLAMLMILAMSTTALAVEEEPKAGLYLGKSDTANVTIGMRDAEGNPSAADQDNALYYPNAVRMEVTYTGKADVGNQFMVLLMEGNNPVPTAENAICYINQVEKEADKSVTFDVYPMLSGSTPMTLYITSNRAEFETIDISMNYVAPYKLGDVNDDGVVDVGDAVLTLQHAAELTKLTGSRYQAADVTGEGVVDVGDAVKILQYAADIIDSFN